MMVFFNHYVNNRARHDAVVMTGGGDRKRKLFDALIGSLRAGLQPISYGFTANTRDRGLKF